MIDINNESGTEIDEKRLQRLAFFILEQLRIHPKSELSVLLVDEQTMAGYHEKFMGEPGPTDVLSFPMDELRPPTDDEDAPEGLLGDVVLCPAQAALEAEKSGRDVDSELDYILTHGVLHLLGFDHATYPDHKVMFDLTERLIAMWDRLR